MHDLITCESKVQVVVALGRHEVLFALGRHEVLTNDTLHVLLQSENVFELGGITKAFIPVSLETYNGPKRKQKQCLCIIWGTNKEYYGIFRSGLFRSTLSTIQKSRL